MSDEPPGWRGLVRRLSTSKVAFGAWVVVVVLLAVPLLYSATASIGPGTVGVGIRPAWRGHTELAVPPLGTISATTHRAPVALRAELREVDVLEAIEIEGRPDAVTADDPLPVIEAAVREDLPAAVRTLALTLTGVAVACGVGAAAMFPGRRSARRLAAGALIGPVAIAAMVAPAAIGFDPGAFATEPELTGQLASADELLARVGGLDTPFGSVESRTRVLSERLAGLYSATVTEEIDRSEGEVVLLHVSDLHLNAVGLSLARDLAQSFAVDAVVDTGDITSFGYEPEARFTELLGDVGVPYYLVAGNHDSAEVRRRLAASDDVVLLDGDLVDIAGLRVLGIGDPTMTALRSIPRERLDQTYRDQFASTRRLVGSTDPDLLLVHNPVQASPVIGRVPAVAAGHLHRSELEVAAGTVIAVVGSSGATGVGNLLVDEDLPYRFELLRFVDGDLVAVDQIELRGAAGDLRLERRLLGPDEDELDRPTLTEEQVEEPARDEVDAEVLDQVTSTTVGPSTTTSTTTPPTTSSGSSPGG